VKSLSTAMSSVRQGITQIRQGISLGNPLSKDRNLITQSCKIKGM
jgi:hypothetical protein